MTELRVEVPDDVAARLAAQAAERGRSAEEIAAELLTEHTPAATTGRRPGFVGLGRSGRHDLSERTEEIIGAELDS